MNAPSKQRPMFMAAIDEGARAEALRALDLIGSPPERCFDQIAHLAQAAAATPVAMVSFVDEERQWFKAIVGATGRGSGIHRAFCLQALNEEQWLWVEDAARDPRFHDNPLVVGRPWIRFYAGAPIRLHTGEAVGSVSVVSDEPRAFNATLARQLRVLADLAGDECALRASLTQLRVAQAEAETARQVKSAFLTNMSHELRTPLNGVIAAAEILAGEPLTNFQSELVQIVNVSAQNLCAVLDDVLELSSQATVGTYNAAVVFNPAEIARQALAFYEADARAKGLKIVLDLADAERDVMGQPAGVRQILRALISNAVKFTAAGEVRVTAKVRRVRKILKISFDIEDTGVGFGPDIRERLFEPFEMGDGSLTRRQGGLGAGLAIANALTDRLGGKLEARSKLGKGSSFRVSLPLAAAPEAGESLAPPPVGRCGARVPRVLVAEDHPTNQRVLDLILGAAGIDARFVENGALAVDAVQRSTFDIVLMDMQMPVMDGLTAIGEIRRLQAAGACAATPICTLTAHAMPEHELAAREAGAQDHLTKPIVPAELLACIARLTGWSPQG